MDRVHRGGPWTGSMGWSMDRVHRGGPWTRVHVLYTSPRMGLFPSIGVSVPKRRSRRSTTTNHNQSTNDTTTKKEGGKILSEKDALSYRSPPFIGTWDEYNKFLKTGGLVLPKKKRS